LLDGICVTSKPPIDLLAISARFAQEQRMSLRDPKFAETFTGVAKETLAEALANDALLYGQRTQNMFEALIVSLGQYKLLKTEDVGVVHPIGMFTAPDFRVILREGSQWLIEVKNVHDSDPGRQRFRIRKQDYTKLQNYASAMNCPLKLALYWARWRVWTLIDGADLAPADDKLGIDMFKAAQLNDLSRLGDRLIGTTPPLRLRFVADKSKPHSISPTGEVAFTIGEFGVFSGATEITDTTERNIVWIFMQFGDWVCNEPQAIMNGNELEAIEFEWSPKDRPNEGQNFEMIGAISAMFSRFYATQTLGEQGVVQTQTELRPDWLAPLIASEEPSTKLPLWRFIIQPNRQLLPASTGPN
jgi:hypothetical protein